MTIQRPTSWRTCGVAVVLFVLAGRPGAAQQERAGAPQNAASAAGDIRILHVRDSIYALFGAGGNITASVGPDGGLLVDTGARPMAAKVVAALAQIQREASLKARAQEEALPRGGEEARSSILDSRDPSAAPRPLRYIVNTSVHAGHMGGNAQLAATGATMTFGAAGGAQIAGIFGRLEEGASIIAHENVGLRLGTGKVQLPQEGWPASTYSGAYKSLSQHFNGEGVQVIHVPSASTDGDSVVHFRRADVIAAGDLFMMTAYPFIDVDSGGSIQGVIDGLNRLLDMSVVEFRAEGGTVIVPGHGRLADRSDLGYYRDMVTIIRDRIRAMARQGMPLDQIKAARPTLDYDPRFGADNGPWTTAMFVEAVYRSLPNAKPAGPAANR